MVYFVVTPNLSKVLSIDSSARAKATALASPFDILPLSNIKFTSVLFMLDRVCFNVLLSILLSCSNISIATGYLKF